MKELIFDMDGTIADLFNVKNWKKKLHSNDPTPYITAKPIYDMDTLNCIVYMLKDIGYRIKIVSWGSKVGGKEFLKVTETAKKEWLKRYDFPADEIHVVPYGTPKQNFATTGEESILIDDNTKVRESFQSAGNTVIDATKNILESLTNLLYQ